MSESESQRLEQLRAEARYHRQRLDLYRARIYGGRPLNVERLEEFQRASDAAAERLDRAFQRSARRMVLPSEAFKSS